MVETLLGLIFLSTAFILSHLMGDIDRYLAQAQLLQARYLYNNPDTQNITPATVATDYQQFRTIRINIGVIMILQHALFAVGIISLWIWAWYLSVQPTNQATDYKIWALIILGLMTLVIFFQFAEFTVGSGHEGIIKILTSLATQPVCGYNVIFREYSRRIISVSGNIPREAVDKRFSMNLVAKSFFWLSQHAANYVSFGIFLGQFVIMYGLTRFIPNVNIFNQSVFFILLLAAIIIWFVYVLQTRKTSRKLEEMHKKQAK